MKHLILLIGLVACVKPYDFDPASFDRVLVVDGLLTDQPGINLVDIRYTYPIGRQDAEFVNDAEVWVEDDSDSRIDYHFESNGRYWADSLEIGVAGRKYQLFVRLSDGTLYQSSQESLLHAPPIDSIYDRYAEMPNEKGDQNVGGIQFFIDTHDDTGLTKYYRYSWEEGYKIVVPFPATHEVMADTVDTVFVYLNPSPGICYLESESSNLIFGSTLGSTQNRMAEFPVRFVSVDQQQLRTRYSLLVRQYAISETAYLFYKRLKESNESGGTLFDRQNGSVFGNIVESETNEQVLGFFEVSGVASKRAFFSHHELDDRLPFIEYAYNCSYFDIIATIPDSALYWVERIGGNVYQYSEMPPSVSIHTESCTSCAFYASTTPPDYWQE